MRRKPKEEPPQIVYGMTLSDVSAANLHVDGSLTLEQLQGRRNVLFRLTAAEVRELLRFFAEMPEPPRGAE
jgi:hypothetical protein